MKVILLVLLLLSVNSYGTSRGIQLSVAAPLATTYGVTTNGLVASEIMPAKSVSFLNRTPVNIACVFSGNATVAPSAVTVGHGNNEILVATSERFTMEGLRTGKVLFCRSAASYQGVSGYFEFNSW